MYSENILILTYWSYKDALIQTYTLPYVKIIRRYLNANKKIFLRTVEQEKYSLKESERLESEKMLANQGIFWTKENYYKPGPLSLFFFLINFIKLLFLCKKEKIRVIHIWCMPPSIIAYLLSLFTGATIVLDSYEPHAEAMVENGEWSRKSLKFKILFIFEKLISRRAKVVISATQGMRSYARVKYKVSFDNFFVKPACVDLNLFSKQKLKSPKLLKDLNLEGKLICVYAGKFGGIYLKNEIFDFFKVASDYWGENFRVLILTSHSKEEIDALGKKSGLDSRILIQLFAPHEKVPEYMGLADFAVTPVKPVPSKKYCTPIKDGEYWALGLPVVIPNNISDDSEIIMNNQIGAVLNDLNEVEYLKAVKKIDELLSANSKEAIFDKIRQIALTYRNFDVAEGIYSKIYN